MKNKGLMLMVLMMGILVGVSVLVSAQLPQYTCVDSDGQDYFVKGSTYQVGYQGTTTKMDVCLSQNNVREYFCHPNYPLQVNIEQYTCPNGCSDGACVSGGTSGVGPAEATATSVAKAGTRTSSTATKTSSSSAKARTSSKKVCPASMTETTSAEGTACCIPKKSSKATGRFLGFMFRD